MNNFQMVELFSALDYLLKLLAVAGLKHSSNDGSYFRKLFKSANVECGSVILLMQYDRGDSIQL